MEYAFRNTLTRFLLVLGLLALLTGIVWAQGTSELTGLVSDPSGAVVANVQVNITNTATGEKRSTTTTPAGIYRFSALPVGTYNLEVAPKGFKSVKVANIVTSVGASATHDVHLELGATSEQVTVEAGAETVQTTESSVSQLVDHRIWENMPLQVRNQNSFINLVAGASPQSGSGTNRGAEVNGTRSGAGSYLVEGSDNNEQGQAGRGQISPYDEGGASTSISPDAIQEYRVITNSYSAEYGKGGGFITDTVLKGGTNNWHGSAFEYNRIQALTANDWFSTKAGIKDSLVRNQFGGSIGGPIIKDKTFFYGTAELHRVRQSTPYGPVTVVTTPFMDFLQSGGLQSWAESDPNGFCVQALGAACPGAFAVGGNIGPIASNLLANPAQHYPTVASSINCATDTTGACFSRDPYAGGFGLQYPVPIYGTTTLNDPQTFDEARWTMKVDHNFSDKDQIHGVFLFQDGTSTEQFTGGFNTLGPEIITDGRGENFALTWNHTLTPTILNNFRAGYLRHRLDFPSPKGTFGVPAYYTIDGISEDFGQYSGLPQFFTENQFQYSDTMSVVKGKHSLKFGGEYRRIRNGSSFFNDAFSSIFPWSVEGALTDLQFTNTEGNLLYGYPGGGYGAAYLASAAVNKANGQEPDFYRGYRANEYAAFLQDDFRVSNRLTLNLGLRWEYFGPPHNFQSNIDSNFYFGTPVTPTAQQCTDPVSGLLVSCASLGTANPYFPSSNPFYASVATGTFQVRNNEIWNKDTNNFAPRLGFAWDVFGTQKFVVRAGAGVMYDRIYNNLFENIRFNPPFFSDNQIGIFATGVPTPAGALTFPFTSRALFNDPAFAPKPNPRHMDQNVVTPYYEQVHFGVQWEFAKGWVFEPEYVGTWGRKLTGIVDINTFDGRVSGNGSSSRVNSTIGADNFRTNAFRSNYNAVQMSLRKNYSSGLSLTANYTYSKALDTLSDAFNGKGALSPVDDQNIAYNYGPADFDLRHRIVATVGYELPFMKSNRWIGGWGVNSIISWQTGHPFSPYSSSSGYDLNKNGQRTDRLVPLATPSSTVLSSSASDACSLNVTGKCYFDTTQWVPYVCPLSVNGGDWCNAPIGRNAIYGPHYTNVDFNVSKRFKVWESAGLTFQANFFNLFNHPNFLPPQSATTSADIQNGNFGQLTSTTGDTGGHRVIQLALRFDF
jgi:hypothetical protein